MYAIIDIETTGAVTTQDRITEVAIFIHDGKKVINEFNSLINPERSIPPFISNLTGITNEMVANAPTFAEVAKEIAEITEGCVFVAHNVNFDYPFIKKEFNHLGYNYQRKTLCTVRLSRKLIPGMPSYSLGNLCESLGIKLEQRHRAIGDAAATVKLFERLLEANEDQKDLRMIQSELKTNLLPPNVNIEEVNNLPEETGVYYLYNEEKEIIYIGKSKNIRQRIIKHFSVDYKSKKAIEFKKAICSFSFEITGSELVALLLESAEIKFHQPMFNRAQKRTSFHFGVYSFEDENGYINFTYDKISNRNETPLLIAATKNQIKSLLLQKVKKHRLCQKLSNLYKTDKACFDYQIKKCDGACICEEDPEIYNHKAKQALSEMQPNVASYMIVGNGRNYAEKSVVVIENGRYIGFGYLDIYEAYTSIEGIKNVITEYEHNKDVQSIITNYLRKNKKDKIIHL